jgi:hypothetical protein
MSQARVYVSFDIEHDRELYERLLVQAGGSGFSVSARSEEPVATDLANEQVRRRIREADELIVICGEYTDGSPGMTAEIRIAQEEKTPYFLLWGRRESLCTKPTGAKTAEGMYRWTPEILQDQVAFALRRARALAPREPAVDATRHC